MEYAEDVTVLQKQIEEIGAQESVDVEGAGLGDHCESTQSLSEQGCEEKNGERSVESDDHSKPYSASIKYADDNLKVLHNQLKCAGLNPLQFIPLEEIRREVNDIVAHMSDTPSTPQQDARLEYLFECLKYNEDYKREQAEVCGVLISCSYFSFIVVSRSLVDGARRCGGIARSACRPCGASSPRTSSSCPRRSWLRRG